jgi:hypothetical protein
MFSANRNLTTQTNSKSWLGSVASNIKGLSTKGMLLGLGVLAKVVTSQAAEAETINADQLNVKMQANGMDLGLQFFNCSISYDELVKALDQGFGGVTTDISGNYSSVLSLIHQSEFLKQECVKLFLGLGQQSVGFTIKYLENALDIETLKATAEYYSKRQDNMSLVYGLMMMGMTSLLILAGAYIYQQKKKDWQWLGGGSLESDDESEQEEATQQLLETDDSALPLIENSIEMNEREPTHSIIKIDEPEPDERTPLTSSPYRGYSR